MDRNYTTFSDARDPDPIDKFIDQAIAAEAERDRYKRERDAAVEALRNCVKAQDATGGPKGSSELAATEGARFLLNSLGELT